MLTETDQITNLLETKRQVLIAVPPNADGDALSAAIALKAALEKKKKNVDIVCAGFNAPKKLNFLPKIDEIKNALAHLHKFILKVDTSNAPIDSLSYDIKDNWLSIYLTPKSGSLSKSDLRTAQTAFKYDVIFTIGAADFASLGDVFFNNTDLFYRLPVINIDTKPHNENFGQINLVELNVTALCEIVYHLIDSLGDDLFDQDIATALLAGMIIKTRSFKTTNVTPSTLNLASDLIKSGANRDDIIHHLYRTKSIPSLRLWGAALSHLEYQGEIGLVISTLTRDDFVRSGASENDIDGIIDELLLNSPETKMILLICESVQTSLPNQIYAILHAEKNIDAMTIMAGFNPQGNKKQVRINFTDKTLKNVEEIITTTIKKHLA